MPKFFVSACGPKMKNLTGKPEKSGKRYCFLQKRKLWLYLAVLQRPLMTFYAFKRFCVKSFTTRSTKLSKLSYFNAKTRSCSYSLTRNDNKRGRINFIRHVNDSRLGRRLRTLKDCVKLLACISFFTGLWKKINQTSYQCLFQHGIPESYLEHVILCDCFFRA